MMGNYHAEKMGFAFHGHISFDLEKPQRFVCSPQETPGPGQKDANVVHLLTMLLELLFRLFLGDAVSLLDFAEELITLSTNDLQIIVGEFAPFLPNCAFELFPVSCHLIPVHTLASLKVAIQIISN
jgi:hypothetical protein